MDITGLLLLLSTGHEAGLSLRESHEAAGRSVITASRRYNAAGPAHLQREEIAVTSHERSLPAVRPAAVAAGAMVAASDAGRRARLLRARLRGKWVWLVVAGALGVGLGGMLGWWAAPPVWRAALTLHIEPMIAPTASQETTLDAFDAFVQRQQEALQHPGVQVESDGRVPARLTLSAIDADAATATARVAKTIETYRQSAVFQEQTTLAGQLEDLLQRRREAAEQLAQLRARQREMLEQVGPLPLDQAVMARTAEQRKIEQQLSETQIAIATLEAVAGSEDDEGVSQAHLSRLARSDAAVAQLLTRQQELTAQIDAARHRLGENAPARIELRQQLQIITQQLEARARQALTAQVRLVGLEVDGAVTLTVDELRRRQRTLQEMHEQATAQTAALVRQQRQLAEIQDAIDGAQQQLQESTATAQQLAAGGRATGRVVIEQHEPRAHLHDDPRLRHGVLGGAAGGAVMLLLALVVVATDQRILRPETAEAASGAAPLLGRVPVMGEAADGSQSDRAAMSIHEIRALLEIRARTSGAQAFALTSPGKGAGKTSLTVGLASSLAMSGTRTLLVDCELMSRTGDTGRTSTAPTPPAGGEGQPRQSLDEVMMMLGYLDDAQTDIFLLPEHAKVGLVGMLEGAALDECVMETSVPGLSILPAAGAQAHHVGKLSARFIRRLLAEAKPRYDMILFDTGPIPGSVESLFVAAEVDEVILVVSRGELQSRVDKTLGQLRMIGARLAGTVFNRAADKTAPAKGKAFATGKRPISSLNMGSGIFAAAVQAQAHMQPGATASERVEAEDDEAITPADAGDMYQALLNEELDADEATAKPTPAQEPSPTADTSEHDVLDDLLDNVIGSAKRSRERGKDGHS